MSSGRFSADLHPEPLLRRIVLFSGAGFALLGVALIVSLPLPPAARIAASVAWLLCSARELLIACRGFANCRRLRLSVGGEILLLDAEGAWHPARLLPGSVVLRRVGWIVFETGEGRRLAEPVRGRCRGSHDWRRLQVIWRHIGGTL